MQTRALLSCALSVSFAFLIGLAAPGPAARADTAPVAVSWVFDTHQDGQGNPVSRVFLRVAGRRMLVESHSQLQYSVTDRAGYKDLKVPRAALAACTGWWAGGGENLYVIRRGPRLLVLRRWQDEQGPDLLYKLLRVIPLPPPAPPKRV